MTRGLIRFVVTVVAVIGLAFCAGIAVREVAVSGSGAAEWPVAERWSQALAGAAWVPEGVVGVALLVAAMGCLVLALVLPFSVRSPRDSVSLGDADGAIELRLRGLERGLAARVCAECPGVTDAEVVLTVGDDGPGGSLDGRVLVAASPVDLVALHGRVAAIVERDVRATCGLATGPVVLEVVRVVPAEGAVR